MTEPALIVIAKRPVPGRVKTRLTPPLTPEQAAELAAATLRDTLVTVARTPAPRRVLAFDGDPSGWVPAGFDVVPQPGGGLGDRLAAAFAAVDGPAVLVGMDTPQLSVEDLAAAGRALAGADAVLGPTVDGGYWCIGLRTHVPGVFAGVPMSTETTCARQRARLAELGMSVCDVRALRDVDTFDDALAVAQETPATRFAQAVHAITGGAAIVGGTGVRW